MGMFSLRRLVSLLGLMAAMLGLVVISGWNLRAPLLLQIHPTFAFMQFNTALGFLLSGIAIMALESHKPVLVRWLSAGVLLIGGLTLLQITTGYDLHIDQLFMKHYLTVTTATPGRMAPNTAFGFTLVAAALFVLISPLREGIKAHLVGVMAPAILALALIALSGYALGFEAAYGWGSLSRMAVHTACGFIALGLALLLTQVLQPVFTALPGIGIALLVLVLTLWQAMRVDQAKGVEALARVRGSQIQSNWQLYLDASQRALQRIAARKTRPEDREATRRLDAENHIQDFDALTLMWINRGGGESVFGDALAAQQVLAHLPLNPCLSTDDFNWRFFEREAMKSEWLAVQIVPTHSPRLGQGCIVAAQSLNRLIEDVRKQFRSDRYPWTLSAQGRPIYHESSDGRLTVQLQLYPEQAGLSLSLTPTKEQLGGNWQPEWVLMVGLVLNGLILLVLYWIGVARRKVNEAVDLQEQIKRELELRRHVIDGAPYGILMINQDGRIEMCNHALCDLFGFGVEELVGQTIEVLIPTALHPTHVKLRETYASNAIVARGMATNRQVYGRHRHGGTVAVEVNLAPGSFDGRPGVIAMVVDVRERLSAQERIAAQLNQLTRVNEELNNFAYVASHDLKSPLRGIDQLATWIAEDLADTLGDDTREHLRLMRSRIRRMEILLDDLLAYSRVGRSVEGLTRVNTRELVENVFELQAAQKPIQLVFTGDMPTIEAQKVPLELVFRNLIGNAIKHHDKQQGTIRISARKIGDDYEFTVQDDGPGIPKEHQERVFTMFQTLKPRDEVEGSGMGLALVKKAVESVGGRVTLESDGQHGCTFHFTWSTHISAENA